MPRFPFKRSVGQDLRDLFAHDRLKQQERGLGYSSISPGEGSAEVRDAAGATLAQFGHAAGKAGFLVPDGSGGWQTVQEHTSAAVAAGTTSLTSRMTTAEGRLDDHASRIGAVEGRMGTAEGRLDSHASRLGALENKDVAIVAKQGEIIDRLNELEDFVASQHPTKPIYPPITKG